MKKKQFQLSLMLKLDSLFFLLSIFFVNVKLINSLKLINYSWGQQPINEAYLGQMIPNEHSDENLTGFDLRLNTCILMNIFQ